MGAPGIAYFDWNDAAVDLLRRGFASHLSAGEIARGIGIALGVAPSRNAVIGKMHRMGLRGFSGERGRSPRRRVAAVVEFAETVQSLRTAPAPPSRTYNATPGIEATDIAPEATTSAAITLLDLEPHHCRWPIGDPKSPDFHFCGCARAHDEPYCAAHAARAFNDRVSNQEASHGSLRGSSNAARPQVDRHDLSPQRG